MVFESGAFCPLEGNAEADYVPVPPETCWNGTELFEEQIYQGVHQGNLILFSPFVLFGPGTLHQCFWQPESAVQLLGQRSLVSGLVVFLWNLTLKTLESSRKWWVWFTFLRQMKYAKVTPQCSSTDRSLGCEDCQPGFYKQLNTPTTLGPEPQKMRSRYIKVDSNCLKMFSGGTNLHLLQQQFNVHHF